MTASVWDDPDLRVGGEYVTFENPGDSIAGNITGIYVHKWDDGTVCPKLLITTDSGEEKTVTAGQVRLKAELKVQRPEVGDHITITHTEVEKRAGGKTLKHFTVAVRRNGGATPAPAAPIVQATPVDPAAAAAALANLTPEQKTALGL